MKYKVPLVTLRLGDLICIIPGFIGPGCYGKGYRDAYGVWKWLPSFVVTAMAPSFGTVYSSPSQYTISTNTIALDQLRDQAIQYVLGRYPYCSK